MLPYHHLEAVIGLEIHTQLKTRSKLFCSCDNDAENATPNTLICPICVGHPGTLPNPNREALRYAVRAGLALNCKINSPTFFDRKHYSYPDLPKGYQISQFDTPVSSDGELTVEFLGATRPPLKVRIERIHLEEDAAKNIHRGGKTLVDFNRSGTPLIEMVTKPDLRTPEDAKAFLQEYHRIMRTIGVSDANMEKGHMRCDANVSLRPVDADGNPTEHDFYPKTEVKNMNSFKAVERALFFEIQRQKELWEANTPPAENTTRGWDAVKQKTILQRTKEVAADYRYMREPDLPPVDLESLIKEERDSMTELPAAKRLRFKEEFGLADEVAWTLTDDPALAEFCENTASEFYAWIVSNTDATEENVTASHREILGRLLGTWLSTKLLGLLEERKEHISTVNLSAENFSEFLAMIFQKKLTNINGLIVLKKMLENGNDPHEVINSLGLQIDTSDNINEVADKIITAFPSQVAEYRSGKTAILQFFVGQVMKETKGNGDPEEIKKTIVTRLAQ